MFRDVCFLPQIFIRFSVDVNFISKVLKQDKINNQEKIILIIQQEKKYKNQKNIQWKKENQQIFTYQIHKQHY